MRSWLPTLHLKALRDLWQMRGQALAIALVVASGIAMLVMSLATLDSLRTTRDQLQQDYAFADLWVRLKRAPESLAQQVAALPGIDSIETRLQTGAKLKLPAFDEPVEALLQSLPDDGSQPRHNQLYLRAGRMPAPHAHDEILVGDAFAEAHQLKPGDRLQLTVNGRSQWLTLAGIAISPEYLYQVKPGALAPDYRRYTIAWLPRSPLAAALNMKGAFNHLTVRLAPGSGREEEAAAIAAIDRVLARWGGLGAGGRLEQVSYRFLHEELQQLAAMTRIFPAIFLGVAAFLLNVLFSRLISTQRAQVAILKAFGYRTHQVVLHYSLIALLICLLGALLGIAFGSWLGHGLAGMYQMNFRFPYLHFTLDWRTTLLGVLLAMLAALAGAGRAVLKASSEPVAQAMRPQMPERYRRTLVEQLGLSRWLSQPVRMVLRQIERRPWRALLSVVGLALAGALLMMARFQTPTIVYMVDVQYRLADHYDIAVHFIEATPTRSLHELRALPGVDDVEGLRSVPVRLSHRNHSKMLSIEGLSSKGTARRPVNQLLQRIDLPPDGLVMSSYLAGMLSVSVGDIVQIEVLQGKRRRLQLPVVALVTEFIGIRVYMDLAALNRALGEGELVSGALLQTSPRQQLPILQRLEQWPKVLSADARQSAIEAFFKMMNEVTGPFTWIAVMMGGIVNFGVVYNAARITLAERARELASLRVLGFSIQEVSSILVIEIVLLVLLSIPLSFALGQGLIWLLVHNLQSELYRVPAYFPAANYSFATLVTLISTLLSLLVVLRKTRRLDMIEALKTHE